MQTTRLYYDDQNLLSFDSRVTAVRSEDGNTQVALERTAFYPTSGGQSFDTGVLSRDGAEAQVVDVVDDDADVIWHVLDRAAQFSVGDILHGEVDATRRLDHRQQHTGQHLLSAVLWERFKYATVSFHMGSAFCTIDLDSDQVSEAQISEAREEANRIIAENRPLSIHYCSAEEARARGVRKIAAGIERVRLIEIPRIDLNACGGTHVNATGEIGCILTRKVERVRQGSRVEFVCGLRAVQAATRDYQELRTAGEKLSSGAWAIAEQVDKILQESKSQAKRVATLESEVAQLTAAQIASQAKGMIVRRFDDRDASFVKLLAQNVVRAAQNPSIVIFAAGAPSPTLVLARTEHNELKNQHMGELLKSVLTQFGGRGGGSASFAQGGLSSASQIDAALAATAEAIAIAS